MAWIRCCGGQLSKKGVLYEAGTWFVDYDNPGSYTYAGYNPLGATLNASNIQITADSSNVRIIGVKDAIDLTNVNAIKVRCYSTGSNFCKVGVWGTKVVSNPYVTYEFIPTGSGYTEISIDVSALSGNYYIAAQSSKASNMTAYIDKIWLE